MKAIFVQPALPNYRVLLFNLLAKNNSFDVDVYFGTAGDFLDHTLEPLFSAKNLGRKIGGRVWELTRFWKIKFSPEDVLVLCGAPRDFGVYALLLIANFKKVPVVWWGHLKGPETTPFRFAWKILMLRFCSGVFCYTEWESRFLKRVMSLKAINFSLPTQFANNGVGNALSTRCGFETVCGGLNILYLGRVTGKADLEELFSALVAMDGEINRVDIVGELIDQNNIRTIERFKSILGCKLVLHGGVHDDDQLWEIVKDSHCFVYPGSVGLSLIKAMSFGLVCVIPRGAKYHQPEGRAFKAGVHGLSYDWGDSSSLVDCLRRVRLRDLDAIGLKNFETARKQWDIESMADRFVQLIEEVSRQ